MIRVCVSFGFSSLIDVLHVTAIGGREVLGPTQLGDVGPRRTGLLMRRCGDGGGEGLVDEGGVGGESREIDEEEGKQEHDEPRCVINIQFGLRNQHPVQAAHFEVTSP